MSSGENVGRGIVGRCGGERAVIKVRPEGPGKKCGVVHEECVGWGKGLGLKMSYSLLSVMVIR